MTSINDRITDIIIYFKLNKNSFSSKIGLKNNVTIGNIVGGRLNKPSYDIIKKILLSFDCINAEWLITGKGQMLKNEPASKQRSSNDNHKYCELCKEKEKVIAAQQESINLLKEQINFLISNHKTKQT